MEYRRRTQRYRRTDNGSSGGVKAILLCVVFCAAIYLIIGTGVGKKLKEGYAVSLLESCTGVINASPAPQATEASPNVYTSEQMNTPAPNPTGETIEVSLPGVDIYMIQLGIFNDRESAVSAAEEIKSLGGAGYVFDDSGSFRVIAAAYSDEASVNSVNDRLNAEGRGSEIFRISSPGVQLLITAGDQRLVPIRTAFAFCYECITLADDLSLRYDSENMSLEQAKSILYEIETNVRNACLGIEDLSNGSEILEKISAYYYDVESFIASANVNFGTAADASSKLKELRVSISLRYFELLKQIGG